MMYGVFHGESESLGNVTNYFKIIWVQLYIKSGPLYKSYRSVLV